MYKKIIEDIFKSGGEAYICGGYVRDMLINKNIKIKDIDLEVFKITKSKFEEILSKYGQWKKAGKQFEVYIFENKYDFSFPRDIDGNVDTNMSVENSSKRRDFTMNSLYYNISNDRILDFNNGISDIKNKLIRQIKENSLIDDPIRILRAIQFMARYEFKIEDETLKKIKENFFLLKNIDKERIFYEIEKILMKAEKPSKFFLFLKEKKLINMIFPELNKLCEIMQDKEYHPEGDVFTHTMMALDVLKPAERTLEVMFALLWHDEGKGRCEIIKRLAGDCEKITFKDHAKISAERVSEYYKKLSDNKKLLKNIENLIFYHEAPLKMMLENKINKISIRKLAVKTDIVSLLKVYKADVLGRGKVDNSEELEALEKIKKIYFEVKDELEPLIKGSDLLELGFKPGAELGELLKKIYEAQLEEKFNEKKSGIEFFKTKILNYHNFNN